MSKERNASNQSQTRKRSEVWHPSGMQMFLPDGCPVVSLRSTTS